MINEGVAAKHFPGARTANDSRDSHQSPAIIGELLAGLQQAAEEIVPRFLATMPPYYFHDTDPDTRLSHIKAILAVEASGLSQAITLRNDAGTLFTVISDRSYPGQLSELVTQLPGELPLCSARVYTATDGSRVLDVFEFGEPPQFDPTDPRQRDKAERVLAYAHQHEKELSRTALRRHFSQCAGRYLDTVPEARICRQFRLVEGIRTSGNAIVVLEMQPDNDMSSITLGINSVARRRLFASVSRYLGWTGINIQRAYLDGFGERDKEPVSLLSFLVNTPESGMLTPQSQLWQHLERDLRRLGYLDDAVLAMTGQLPNRNLLHAEVLLALSHLIHQVLSKRDALVFSRRSILTVALRYWDITRAIIELFLTRFAVGGERAFAELAPHIAERIKNEVDKDDERLMLATLLKAVGITLRTNVYRAERYALTLQVEPSFLSTGGKEEVPYGIFFVYGCDFDGFHVRFRDIARGGMRIVYPSSQEQYTLESERLYDEAYGLAQAQQLKNKDIPEGGSKGVLLAQPGADLEQVGRAYADALLDLSMPVGGCNDSTDYYGKDEFLYLGPDENVSDGLIIWIVERARRRGHPLPNVFMSSKPGAGINHKRYGVTSEGVTVFLEAALRTRGINPRHQAFSLKLTGGPDGDVAGNEIRILNREYGNHARILGIADGSGCLEDPDGLDHGELLRLVSTGKPVSAFDPARLGPRGRLLRISEAGGLQARNSLHNRLVTDAFIPAGGRPQTINEENWRYFLTPDGRPSSAIIVEGANLFITPGARQRLAQCGAIVIKDSSANKCGVICSSYEIIASMLLDEAGFLAIKERFIAEVLDKLRWLASLEAAALFREHRHKPNEPLPELSTRLSRAIIRATDAIAGALAVLGEDDHKLMRQLVLQYLPLVLVERLGEGIFARIPKAYLAQVIASVLASRIVYREGLDWFEQMSEQAMAELAIRYSRQEEKIQNLAAQIEQSDLPDRGRIAELLREGGTAAALRRVMI